MRGHHEQDAALRAFIGARTQELHRGAYQLTADQESAERLVVAVLTELGRERFDLSRAGAAAHLRMVRLAARDAIPTGTGGDRRVPERFRVVGRLSPRQRAALVLQTVAGYDDKAIARTLQLSPRATSETLHSIPYPELPDRPGELRSLLEDFGDLAHVPHPATTIEDVHTAPSGPQRPWWTFAAAFLVLALSATSIVVAQGWHKDWLRTPDGLNHAHGTHFPTYAQGYKLVDIRDMVPGIAQNVTTGPAGAVALPCGVVESTVRLSVQSAASDGEEGDSCPTSATHARLTEVTGRASAMVLGGNRHDYPIAVYRRIPLSEYPVATSNFDVEHDLTLTAVRAQAAGNKTPPGAGKRTVLTLHGTAAHPNGTFTGRLRLPHFDDPVNAPMLHAVGLLSPTTTGTFRVQVAQTPPPTSCDEPGAVVPRRKIPPAECSLLDRRVPQVTYLLDIAPDQGWRPVTITVEHARGPWTLQFVVDSYWIDPGSTD